MAFAIVARTPRPNRSTLILGGRISMPNALTFAEANPCQRAFV